MLILSTPHRRQQQLESKVTAKFNVNGPPVIVKSQISVERCVASVSVKPFVCFSLAR
jgi:hypothetical protein